MSPAVQQEMFLRVMVAAVITFAVVLAAAFLYVAPLGQKSIRAVVPVVHEFMLAAEDGDVVRAHTTYSSRALKTTTQEDIAELLSQREVFEDYKGVQLTSFYLQPGSSDVEPDTATVDGIVSYESQPPTALRAQLALEGESWRIDWIEIGTDD